MIDIVSDMSQPTWLPFSVIAARLLVAAFLGAIIGFEREWRHHSAGLRTHILVSLAAATFAILGIEIVQGAQFEEDSSQFDAVRIIEAVTAGVAFLAAGSIIFARGQVQGLTTGAGMWLAGAIGLASGLGLWKVAAFATLLAVLVLGGMSQLEKRTVKRPPPDEPAGDT